MTKSVLVPVEPTEEMLHEAYDNCMTHLPLRQSSCHELLGKIYKAMLDAAPKAVDEPVGYLDLSKKKITENPYFTVGPVSDSKGWLPVYASPQKSEPELMFDEARIVISSLHQDASIKSYQYMESSLSHRAQRVLAWLNDRTKQPPEQPE